MEKTSLQFRGRFPQRLPVPSQIEPAAPELWELNRGAIAAINFDQLSELLGGALSSVDVGGPDLKVTTSSRQAAVLIPLIPLDDGVGVILTKRSSKLSRHAGEISFPGGGVELGETYFEAAMRETEEEIGLDRSRLLPLGTLGEMSTVLGQSSFYSFVAAVSDPGRLEVSEEVDEVLSVALGTLLNPELHHSEAWAGPGFSVRTMHFFELEGELLWGATARLLSDLLNVLVAAVGTDKAGPS